MTTQCACKCGETNFSVSEPPLFRLICHCSICQRFNDAAYADVAVFRARDVEQPPKDSVSYERLRPPPNVQRGRCRSCGGPAIELFHAPLMPKLTMVPVGNIAAPEILPDPAVHIFYESRVCDVDDPLPKYSGYWRSQLQFGRLLLRSRKRANRPA